MFHRFWSFEAYTSCRDVKKSRTNLGFANTVMLYDDCISSVFYYVM